VDVRRSMGKTNVPTTRPTGTTIVDPDQDRSDKIFVGALPSSVSDDELREFFEKYGPVIECNIMLDKNTGRSRGFGFVTFGNASTAEAVLGKAGNLTLKGRKIDVKLAVARGKAPPPVIARPQMKSEHYGNYGYAPETKPHAGYEAYDANYASAYGEYYDPNAYYDPSYYDPNLYAGWEGYGYPAGYEQWDAKAWAAYNAAYGYPPGTYGYGEDKRGDDRRDSSGRDKDRDRAYDRDDRGRSTSSKRLDSRDPRGSRDRDGKDVRRDRVERGSKDGRSRSPRRDYDRRTEAQRDDRRTEANRDDRRTDVKRDDRRAEVKRDDRRTEVKRDDARPDTRPDDRNRPEKKDLRDVISSKSRPR
jgi:hypothetical protein